MKDERVMINDREWFSRGIRGDRVKEILKNDGGVGLSNGCDDCGWW